MTQKAYDSATRRGRAIVAGTSRACLARVGASGASGEGVQRHLVVSHLVHALDNVDFALVRPLHAGSPDAGPYLRKRGSMAGLRGRKM